METTPEIKTLNFQIAEAEQKIVLIKKQLKSKIKELDTKINDDNADLFGERKSEPKEQVFLFSERVNPLQRDKVINPIKSSLKTAENELQKLINLKSNINQIGITGELF
jgi:hypothetical protein